jgi:hypothetical protein
MATRDVTIRSKLLFGDFAGSSTTTKEQIGEQQASLGPAEVVIPFSEPRATAQPATRHDRAPASPTSPRGNTPTTPHAQSRQHEHVHVARVPHHAHRPRPAPRPSSRPASPAPAGLSIGAHDFAAHSTLGRAPGAPVPSPSPAIGARDFASGFRTVTQADGSTARRPARYADTRAHDYQRYEAEAAARRRGFAEHIDAGGVIGQARPAAKTPGLPYAPPPSRGVRPTEHFTRENAQALRESAARLQVPPEHLAKVIAHETANTFSPRIWGGKGGRYMGLIQFGPRERRQYGAHEGQSFREQLPAVERYLKGRGFKPGMGLADLYSTILAGRPGLYARRDQNGSVAQHVARMQRGEHDAVVRRFLSSGSSGGGATPAATANATTPTAPPQPTNTARR